ncbi:uncharacterized protein LOC132546801 [Ylistrum balloti]|uniref:uncharacterized protein LOC132546801 n=1 Tax=Ylistrum balloti TaxID=509963 RepID=UPI002905D9D4|nr:uncharacterized protein LOC132546801 [Ylistrum balloti]
MVPVYDVIRALALLVGFGVSLGDRKTAMFADMVFTSWLGVGAILFPQFFMGQQVFSDKTIKDPNNILMYRLYGVHILAPMVMWYSCRKSRDDSVIGAMLWSRTLGLFPLLMVMLHGHFTYTKTFTDRNMWFFILCVGCIMVTNIVQLVRTRPSVGRREMKGPVSVILRLDFLLLFIIGLATMAFPKVTIGSFIHDPKNFQVHQERVSGAIAFGHIFLAWFAPSFRENEDRRRFFCMQLTIILLTLGCVACAFYDGSINAETVRLFLGCCLTGILPAAGLYYLAEDSSSSITSKTYFTRSKAS